MPARRFFVEGVHASGGRVAVDASDAHKILRVLRLDSGDSVTVVDSAGTAFEATLERDGSTLYARLGDGAVYTRDAPLRISVAQGVPKGAKMDFIVEKLAELGVMELIPLVTERTVSRDPADGKIDRWRRLARTAAQQSGSGEVMQVAEVATLERLVDRFSAFDRVLFPWEAADARALREVLPGLLPERGSVLVVIGPEGGFSHAEAESAKQAGAAVISLGSQILRTETAALVLAAILGYESAR